MMLSRRTFLGSGATALTVTGIATALIRESAVDSHLAARTLPFKVIFDERFADSRCFAHEAVRLGGTPAAIRGDVAELWYTQLRPRRQQSAITIAGLTTASSLFCLDQLARNHWMKVLFRAEHLYAKHHLIEHYMCGLDHFIRRAANLAKGICDWRRQMADLVTHCPISSIRTLTFTSVSCAQRRELNQEALVSWVIAARNADRGAA